jgi:SHS2 domain-containing protein
MTYKILEHTADFIIQARGKTLEELFSETMRGMFEAIKPKIASDKKIKRQISVKSLDQKALLVDFLSETLYQSDINNEAYFKAIFKKLTETELEAELLGQKIDSFEEEIKAVTHHGLKLEKIKQGWKAEVLFDI